MNFSLSLRSIQTAPVWEITGAEFTSSTTHTAAGVSIRFPRVTRIRSDKDWNTATDLERLKVHVRLSILVQSAYQDSVTVYTSPIPKFSVLRTENLEACNIDKVGMGLDAKLGLCTSSLVELLILLM